MASTASSGDDQVHLDAHALAPSVAEFTQDAAKVLGMSVQEATDALGPMLAAGVDPWSATVSALLAPVPEGTAATAAAGGQHAAHIAAAATASIAILTATDESNAANIATSTTTV